MNSNLIARCLDISKAMYPTVREMRTCHVAFLVSKGKIVKIGWNKDKTHPQNLRYPYHGGRVGIHAELSVCMKMGIDNLSKFSMLVIRYDNNMDLALSKPCIGCQSVIKQFGIREVLYSTKNGIENL